MALHGRGADPLERELDHQQRDRRIPMIQASSVELPVGEPVYSSDN